MFWPFSRTEPGETLLQITGATRLVADCSVNVPLFVGHAKIIYAL